MSIFNDIGYVLKKVGDVWIDPIGSGLELATGNNPTRDLVLRYLKQAQVLLQASHYAESYPDLYLQAQEKVRIYGDLLRSIVNSSDSFSALSSILEKRDPNIALTFIRDAINKSPEVNESLSRLDETDKCSFFCELGGQADFFIGADLAVGCAVGLRPENLSEIGTYTTAGVTLGAEEGADVGVIVGISVQGPKEQAGPFVGIKVDGDVGLGFGVAVMFSLPDLSFSSVAISVAIGEEIQLAGTCGYTWQ